MYECTYAHAICIYIYKVCAHANTDFKSVHRTEILKTKELFDASAASHIAPDTQSATRRGLAGERVPKTVLRAPSHISSEQRNSFSSSNLSSNVYLSGQGRENNYGTLISQDLCFHDISPMRFVTSHVKFFGIDARNKLCLNISKNRCQKICWKICQKKTSGEMSRYIYISEKLATCQQVCGDHVKYAFPRTWSG